KRGSALLSWTGTGPVSSGGSSCTAVSSAPTSTRVPHSGQKRLRFGSRAPQFAHLAAPDMDPLLPRAGGLEGTKQLGSAPAQGPDERAVVLVGDLARAVVE